MNSLDFVLKFSKVLESEGDMFFTSGNTDADARAIKEMIRRQGYWAGVRVRYYFDNDFNLLRTEERKFGA